MNSFEYISVLISVLLGLAITHMVVGIVSIIQNRDSTQVYWVHLLWVVNVVVYITTWWWAFHYWEALALWPQSTFYLLFCYSLILTAVAGLLFPVHGSVADYRIFYYKHASWFFGLQFLWFCLDVIEVNAKASAGLRPVPADYYLFTVPIMVFMLAGVFVKNPKYHSFLAPVIFSWQVLYSVLIFVAIG